jgi:hypothetical protein
MARLEVGLLVCPEPGCLQVGRNPSWQSTKGFCVGSVKEGTAHRKARMVPVLFKGKAPKVVEPEATRG